MSTSPAFLIIGAQKCGTTTLYEDLRAHPDVFLPDKESSGLLDPRLPDPAAVEQYHALFAPASGRVPGEASTRYTMLPGTDISAVARLVTPNAKVLYVVRDPVQRAISHHHHDYALGLMPADIDQSVRGFPQLVDNGRYAMQVEPWIAAFGRSRVHLVQFERFVAGRQAALDDIDAFLGIRPYVRPEGRAVHNAASSKVVATGHWQRMSRNRFYRERLRPIVAESTRRRVMAAVLPRARPRPPEPSAATVDYLVGEFREDVYRLAELTGGELWWNLDEKWKQPRARGSVDADGPTRG